MNTSDYKSFSYLENGDIIFSQYETVKSTKKLDSGSYRIDYQGYPREEVIVSVDSDFETPKSHNFSDKEKINNLYNSFFNKDVLFKIESLGFCHKVGVLLYGMEGTGKSTIIKEYCTKAIKEHNAIVFHVLCKNGDISRCWHFMQNIRRIQVNPIIIVFDEFDQQMQENEAFLKTAIDGNMSIHNCFFFAATNYFERIPPAMSNRPSRFKYSLNIEGMQVKEDVENIITPIIGDLYTAEEIKSIAHELNGNTLDHIKQYCLDKIMEINHYNKPKRKIGFGNIMNN